jgi:hypothetical protein
VVIRNIGVHVYTNANMVHLYDIVNRLYIRKIEFLHCKQFDLYTRWYICTYAIRWRKTNRNSIFRMYKRLTISYRWTILAFVILACYTGVYTNNRTWCIYQRYMHTFIRISRACVYMNHVYEKQIKMCGYTKYRSSHHSRSLSVKCHFYTVQICLYCIISMHCIQFDMHRRWCICTYAIRWPW